MSKIICLLGGSGSGKDTIKRALPLPHVVSYRTRPIREGEENGVDGIFVDDEFYSQLNHETLAAYTLYNGYHYWTTQFQFSRYISNNIPVVYVVDREGVEMLKETFGANKVYAIWLEVHETELYKRMLKRGDTEESARDRINYHREIRTREREICDAIVHDQGLGVSDMVYKVAFAILSSLYKKG
jgi:guanylate kinase